MLKNLRTRSKSISNVRGRRVGRTCLALLDKGLLVDDVAIEYAIGSLEGYIVDPGVDVNELIAEIESVSGLFEFVLSGVSDYPSSVLQETILQGFPNSPDSFEASLAARLLNRFSVSLLFLPPCMATDALELLDHHRRAVELAAPVLKTISCTIFAEDTIEDDDNASTTSPTSPTKRRSQQKRKQSMRARRTPAMDARPFDSYGVPVPATKSAATELGATVLEQQMGILKYYLEIFRNPALAPVFKNAYLPPSPPDTHDDVPTEAPVHTHVPLEDEFTDAPDAGAYPFVQPMKAALYFDSAKGFGQWRVLISNGASQYLRQARNKDPSTFGIIINKIEALSNGHFSDDNQKKLTGSEVQVPIFEAKMTRDTRLVYQIDCVPEFQSNVERQVIRVFGIYTHGQIGRLVWQGMGWHVARKGAEYIDRCNFRKSVDASRGNVFLPGSWPPLEVDTTAAALPMPHFAKEDLDEMHSLLVLEKFVTFSQALLNGILADQNITHVFDVSPKEKQIIEHPSSCYVLGRSGTGKTTTMLFKMLGIERSWEDFGETLPKPRQMFVTQSRVLAEKVEEYFADLFRSLLAGKQTKEEVVHKSARQAMLVDKDEEVRHRRDLPERFGALSDEHFPMFLTFDQICSLLENEYLYELEERQKNEAVLQVIDDSMELRDPSVQSRAWSSDRIRQRQSAFVSEKKFIAEYWPHLRQGLTKGLDPTFVFAEFIGIIKGSEQALEKPEGYLDQETYCQSRRSQAVGPKQREYIYQSFQAYAKRKAERGEWDAADRSHALIRSLRGGVSGQPIDFMYVDEAQDNLLIDAFILRNLCRNPHGMFWAGDTAQTISAGSAFRFNDLKAFMYRVEENMAAVMGIKQVQPESFQLAVNYRSHAGIVNCAHTVVELITAFWPYAIDNLAREEGMIDGLKPVFFSGWDQGTARYEQFLFGESGSHVEFGAQQCILVRDEDALEKLRSQVGDIGLIMTLYEAKGLEFNDVLLYNFFEDSTADVSQWRVVLNALSSDEHVSAPRFDETRHNSICRELKFLYVAITRARKNLWIADSSVKGEPMRTLWDRKGQVETCAPGSDIPQLAMSSSPEEWAATALSLFNNKRYAQAMHCYDRAGLPREKAVAQAYTLREKARAAPVTPRGGTVSQADAYALAAEAFLVSADDAVAEKSVYYRIAAECFVSNGDHVRAADAYQAASEYDLAAQHYRQAGKFESAVKIIQLHTAEMEQAVVQTITDVSKLYFVREHEVKKARELFETDDDALEYMEDLGLDVARATLLKELGKYAEAAELLVEEGNPLEALRLLALVHGDARSTKRAAEIILACLWSILPLGVVATEKLIASHPTLGTLLAHAKRLLSDDLGMQLDEITMDEIAMFHAIASQDYVTLVRLSGRFLSRENFASSLLCLDHVFSVPLDLSSLSLTGLATTLRTFLIYARLLQQLAFRPRPSHDDTISTLFQLRFWTEDLVIVPLDAFVLTHASKSFPLEQSPTGQGSLAPRWEVDSLVSQVLQQRLLTKVSEENSACRRVNSLRPCLTFAASLKCTREGCRQHHGDMQYYSTTSFNARVRIHLLQMLICRTVNALEPFPQQIKQKRFWLYQLYSTMLPAHPNLGALHALSAEHIPELEEGLRLVRLWTEDVLFKLTSRHAEEQYLTQLVQAVILGLTFDRTAALQYLRRVRCTTVDRPIELLRKIGDERSCYIVHDLMRFLENDASTSLNSGFLAVNHVVDKQIPIDVASFCDLLDHLCTCLILTTWGRSTGRVRLHNAILPKSWILRAMPHLHRLPSMDIGLSFLYRRNLSDLLQRIGRAANDSGHLLFENSSLNKVSWRIRNVFLLRILRTLAFWGCNVNVLSLRNKILGIITSLRGDPGTDSVFPPMIEQYVAARHWDDLERIVRHSTFGASSAEELIQLHYGGTAYTSSSRYIRHVTYTRVEDIPRLLNADSLGIFDVAVLSSNPPISVPSVVTVSQEEPSTGRIDSSGISNSVPAPEEESKHEVSVVEPPPGDVEEVALSIDAEQVNVEIEAPSTKKLDAAMVFLTFYRHRDRAARKSSLKKKTAEEAQLRIYTTFLEESKKLQSPHRFYRLLFLGPLPHLFAVVEAMKNHLYESKNRAKKRLSIVQHLELETMGSSLTEIIRRHKIANNLHQVLGPASPIHQERNSEKLKVHALEAYELMKTFPTSTSSKWVADMDIAMRGIVQVRKVAKPMKPVLQLEDDLAVADYL